MRYENTCRAVFLERINRFTARAELDGKTETVHVKTSTRKRLMVFRIIFFSLPVLPDQDSRPVT